MLQSLRHALSRSVLINPIALSQHIVRISTQQNALRSAEAEASGEEAEQQGETKNVPPHKDRRTPVPVEVSQKYIKSAAFKQTYGDLKVWEQYRRNHKGLFPPRKTRKTCIRRGIISTGNPCPICRDEYLVLDYTNVELLQQFISPHTGEVLSYSKTGLCQKQHLRLLVAIEKAKEYGLIDHEVPFREFDYSEYYPNYKAPESNK